MPYHSSAPATSRLADNRGIRPIPLKIRPRQLSAVRKQVAHHATGTSIPGALNADRTIMVRWRSCEHHTNECVAGPSATAGALYATSSVRGGSPVSAPHIAHVSCAPTARQTLSGCKKRSLNVPSTRPRQPDGNPRVMPHANAASHHPATNFSCWQPSCTAKLSEPVARQSPPVKNGHGNGKPTCTTADGASPVPLPGNTAPQRPTCPRSATARLSAPTAFHYSSVAIGVPRATPTARIPQSPYATHSKLTR